jgi:hypothetical protein
VDGFYLRADKGRSACHLPSTMTSLDGMVTWDDGLVQCVMHAKFMHELYSLLTHIPTCFALIYGDFPFIPIILVMTP